jgi:hypothetical protein
MPAVRGVQPRSAGGNRARRAWSSFRWYWSLALSFCLVSPMTPFPDLPPLGRLELDARAGQAVRRRHGGARRAALWRIWFGGAAMSATYVMDHARVLSHENP